MTTQELVGYWRQCSTYADSDDERDTWIRCAEVLEETLRVAAQVSPLTPDAEKQ